MTLGLYELVNQERMLVENGTALQSQVLIPYTKDDNHSKRIKLIYRRLLPFLSASSQCARHTTRMSAAIHAQPCTHNFREDLETWYMRT